MKHTIITAFLLCSSWFATAQTEPSAQPTNLLFTNPKSWTCNLSFSASPDAEGYLILKSNSPVTDVPDDGVPLQKGQWLGNSKVINANNLTFVNVKEMVENTTYYFAIFAFNGSGPAVNYLTTNPLTGSFTTPAASPGSYYDGVNPQSPQFVNHLSQLMVNHTFLAYDDFSNSIVPNLYERDTTNNQKTVQCQYSGEIKVYNPPFTLSGIGFSREHRMPQSWMPAGGNTNAPPGTDFHNLELTNNTQVNVVRLNYPYAEVVNQVSNYYDAQFGYDQLGNLTYEPRDEQKGDAARAMLYMMVCYNGYGNMNWAIPHLSSNGPFQKQDVLKMWSAQDPPDAFERTRNQYVFSIQGSRNCFIDHPQWVECINFDSLKVDGVCVSGSDELSFESIRVYPNPASEELVVENFVLHTATSVVLLDATGRLLSRYDSQKTPVLTIPLTSYPSGIYLLHFSNGHKSHFEKIIKH